MIDTIPLVPERSESTAATPEGSVGLIGINEVAVSPDGRRAYAIGPESSILFKIDAGTSRVTGAVPGESRAHGIAVSPGGDEVWVANRSGSVSIFDSVSLEQLATIPVGDYANHVAFDRNGEVVFVTGRDSLVVIDTSSRSIVRAIPVGGDPHEIAVQSATFPAIRTGGTQESGRTGHPGIGSTRTVPLSDLIPTDDPRRALALANSWKNRYPDVNTYVTAEKIRFILPDERKR